MIGSLFALAAAAVGIAFGGDARAPVGEEGAVAPAGRWTVAGGAGSGSGRTATAPLRGPVEEAWGVDFDGEVEGEPLVWDERVLVAVHEGGDRRVLHTLELATGRRAARPHAIRSERPLAPSLWGSLVAVRRGDDTLEMLQWGRSELSRYWTWRGEGALAPPLLFGSEIHLASAAGLVRLRLGRRAPVWRVEGDFLGRPALSGDSVYALRDDGRHGTVLCEVDRRSGVMRREIALYRFAGPRPDRDAVQIAAHERGVWVYAPVPFLGADRRALHGFGVPRPFPRGETYTALGASGVLSGPPVEVERGWVGYARMQGSGLSLVLSKDVTDDSLVVLATAEQRQEYVGSQVAFSVAGTVGYQGRNAIDLASGNVLWKHGAEASQRSVPARDTLLALESPARLVALRAKGAAREVPLPLAFENGEGVAGRAVLRDGRIEAGSFALRAGSGEIVRARGGREQVLAPEEVLHVESAAGRLLHAASLERYARGLERLLESEEAAAYARLAEQARGTNDVELMARLVGEAALRGASESSLARVRQRIDELDGKSPRISEDRARRVAQEEAALAGMQAGFYWQRFEKAPADAPLRLRTMLLREVLSRGTHAGAADAVGALLPEGARPEAGFDALDWIEFVEVIEVTPVAIVFPPERSSAEISHAERMLGRATHAWRKDLLGFQSQRLLILSPLARPGAIARCLSMGELVCTALASLFEESGGERDPERVLVLYLFESQEEYLAQSAGRGGEAESGLEWTAGHYDYVDNVSRIFLPEGDTGFDDVMRTYAHELAHHWLQMQCPAFGSGAGVRAELPGFWIVEGIACLIEEFQFDLAGRSFEQFDPRARRLDTVANLRSGLPWDWKLLYTITQRKFHELQLSGEGRALSSWQLGRETRVSGRHAFYSQAAATCHYLFHAEGGARRAALLDYLTAFYTGRAEGLSIVAAFGLSEEELGERARAYALAVVAGERP